MLPSQFPSNGPISRFFSKVSDILTVPLQRLYFLYFPNNPDFVNEICQSKYPSKRESTNGASGDYLNHLTEIQNIRLKNFRGSVLHSPAAPFSIILSYVA